ncbi:MAG: methyltransferase domain-containing protein [Gemmataceae bacterium]
MHKADVAHHELVDQLIARGSLWSEPLIAAFRATPRLYFLDHLFHHRENRWRTVAVDAPSDDDLAIVYTDRAITTRLSRPTEGETEVAISSSSQPSLMAQMLEDLDLAPGLRVLEIGAGTGYNAALLAHVVGPLVSLDIDPAVLDDARRHLARFPNRKVQLIQADGRQGYPQAGPYDRIQVTAATDDLEPAWLTQLHPSGLLQTPLDLGPGLAWIWQGRVVDGAFLGRLTRPAFFMPLRNASEPGRDRNSVPTPLPLPESLARVAPPWSHWPDFRAANRQDPPLSLAVLGWLQGMTTGHATLPDSRSAFGVGHPDEGECCWLGQHEWRVSGRRGYQLGLALWRRWLDLGAPRPIEWQLRAAPRGDRLSPGLGVRASHARQGRTCEHLWELLEPRRRLDQD